MADRFIDNPKWQQFASALEQDRGLPTGMLQAIALNETNGGDPRYLQIPSSAGAQGMFQFMPATAKDYNVNVADRADSTRGAADYLADLNSRFKDPHLAAAAYNWGPGNLQKAIAKAQAAGHATDALSLANGGYLPKETSDYVRKLPGFNVDQQAPQTAFNFTPDQVVKIRQYVTDLVHTGMGNDTIVAQLEKQGLSPVVQKLAGAGYTPAEIVDRIGGNTLSDLRGAKEARSQKGFFNNTWDGAKSGASDLWLGAKQIVGAGDEEAMKAEALANANDPERRALLDTGGGRVGYFGAQVAPLAVADILAPQFGAPLSLARAASLVGRGAAIGGAQGALTPTTEDGQRADHIAAGAAFGAGVGGAMAGAGSALRGTANLMRGMPVEEAAARIQAAQKAGIPVGAADISQNLRFVSDQASKVPFAKALGGSTNEAVQEAAIAREIARRFGQEADTIDSSVIASAQREIGQKFEDAVSGVSFRTTSEFTDDLNHIAAAEKSKLPSLQNKSVTEIIDELKVATAAQIEAKSLQGTRSDIGKRMSSTSLEPEAKQALRNISTAIERELERSLPAENMALWRQAGEQWRNLQAAENLVRATNDTGEGLARKLASSIKSGQFKTAFERGNAPYQDLLEVTSKLKPAGKAGPLEGAYQVAGGLGVYHTPALAAGVPLAAGLRRLLNSTNPSVRNAMLGMPNEAMSQAAALSHAITGRATQINAVDTDSQVNHRALADALAKKAAQASQAAGLTPEAPTQQASAQANQAAIQQALLKALASRSPTGTR